MNNINSTNPQKLAPKPNPLSSNERVRLTLGFALLGSITAHFFTYQDPHTEWYQWCGAIIAASVPWLFRWV